MIRFLLFSMFLWSTCVSASAQYNAIATAYVTTTISQNVVFDNTMRQGGTFTFSVLAHNGGGRAGQSDTANVRIQFYNFQGGLMGTFQSSYNANLPNPNAVCGNPCIDPAVPWSTLTVSTVVDAASAANIAYAKISMYGIDGSYWAGDYGPWYRAPTFTRNGGANLAYNPEFGPYNGVTAQGWTSNPGFGACQGAWGGSNACIVNSDGVPGTSTVGLIANQNGGGPDPNGGTTSGTAGGYNSTMTTSSPTGAATAPAAPALCCGGSAAQFNADAVNTAKVLSFVNRTTADSQVYIEQIGNSNTTTIDQSGIRNNYAKYYVNGSGNTTTIMQSGANNTQTNYVDLSVTGNSNIIDIKQRTSGETTSFGKGIFAEVFGDTNRLTVDQKNSGSHYADIRLYDGNKTVNITQQGGGNHMASISLSGQPTGLTLTQSGGTQQFYSITHNCATAGGCGAITVTQGQ